MKALEAIWRAVERLLRGPAASRALAAMGIDVRRFWLLVDLFSSISERGEMMDQLGGAGVALEVVAWMQFGLSALMTVIFVVVQPPVATYFFVFQFFSAFLLFNILLTEAANSLVNPVEAMVLAHQPIDGATYTAAKLMHLLRIILYLVPGMNVVPAVAGLALKGAPWFYPLLHLGTALAVGAVAALTCCAIFGWMLRFVPAKRLKAAGQLAGAIPFLGIMWMGRIENVVRHLHLGRWLPASIAVRWGIAVAAVAFAAAAVIIGIRSLSADYLLRVSAITHGGGAAGARAPRSRAAIVAAGLFGGPPAHGGFAFVSRMMLRDWQFRRLLVPMLFPTVFGLGGLLVEGWRKDPFSIQFSTMHLFPHFLGMLLYFICNVLAYSSEYKGAWIFQLAPSQAIDGFAGGVFALLWIRLVVIPHLILAPVLIWAWGAAHALLFVAYSLALVSLYLGLELRLIEGAPFSRQMDPSRGMASIMVFMAAGLGMAVAVGLQYVLLFRWVAVSAVFTGALAVTAYFVVQRSIGAFAVAIRHHLGLVSGEAGRFYAEVN